LKVENLSFSLEVDLQSVIYRDEEFVKGESICDDNHVVGFVHVFEDLEF
jgi:hypothetical protein